MIAKARKAQRQEKMIQRKCILNNDVADQRIKLGNCPNFPKYKMFKRNVWDALDIRMNDQRYAKRIWGGDGRKSRKGVKQIGKNQSVKPNERKNLTLEIRSHGPLLWRNFDF